MSGFEQGVLDRHAWHMTHTAEALGIARKSLWDKMRRLGITANERGDERSANASSHQADPRGPT